MLGAWPIEPDRLKQYVTKALREGKTHTSWLDVNEDYERRVTDFLQLAFVRERGDDADPPESRPIIAAPGPPAGDPTTRASAVED